GPSRPPLEKGREQRSRFACPSAMGLRSPLGRDSWVIPQHSNRLSSLAGHGRKPSNTGRRPATRKLQADAADLVAVALGEPDPTVRSSRDPAGGRCLAGDRKLLHVSQGIDSADLVAVIFREPQSSIGTTRDGVWMSVGSWYGKLRDHPRCGDPADLAAVGFGEPLVPVGARGDQVGTAVQSWRG